MARINPRDIEYSTECYAVVKEDGYGFIKGKLMGWKLYDLRNPLLRRTLNQDPDEIIAAFETREELEQWLEDLNNAPEPENSGQASLHDLQNAPEDKVELKTIGSGQNKLIISQIL